MIACRSIQTFPRLLKSCSKRRVSSLLIPEVPFVVEPVPEPALALDLVLEAAFTVETRDDAREVVADPIVGGDWEVIFSVRLGCLFAVCAGFRMASPDSTYSC